ncbi:hypothetical protein GCM10009560_40440 [Nonomuraea longicatena]|uniref:Secreted protein n=2 Tax=Nonomuraea longicatena TaxID=83682 RepID=A0ABP4AAE3_9ACTN
MELKNEIRERGQAKRKKRTFLGFAVAGIAAAAAAVAVPLLTGGASPAYAVTKGADGAITVQVHEFRDADKLEADLRELGVKADVSYLPGGKWCGPDRGKMVAGFGRGDSSDDALATVKGGVRINPAKVGAGNTVVMEFAEAKAGEKPSVLWQIGARVIAGPVAECKVIDDPSWNDVGGPEGQPPAHLR